MIDHCYGRGISRYPVSGFFRKMGICEYRKRHGTIAVMVKVISRDDCGNAPRKRVLLDWLTALASGDLDKVLGELSESIVWDIVGDRQVEGLDAARQYVLERMDGYPGKALRIDNIITHGTTAAANGTLVTKDGRSLAFCDVYTFTRASVTGKIRTITTYQLAPHG
jgi:hypothetical protein